MWTPSFIQDTDKPGVGTATATSDDPPATYSRRVDTNNAKDVSAFCAEAKAMLDKVSTDKTDREAFAAKIFAELQK